MNQKINDNNVVGNKHSRATIFVTALLLLAIFTAAGNNLVVNNVSASGPSSPPLGQAGTFAILGASAITDVPTSAITGDVGLRPAAGSFYAGLTCVEVTGAIYETSAGGPAPCAVIASRLLTNAQGNNTAAYGNLAGQTCTTTYTGGTDLVTKSPLGPGVYCSASSLALSGTLVLSGSGVWVFQMGSTLTTTGTAKVVVDDPCNVWWQVGSSATLGTNTQFAGNILALTSITINTGVNLEGRALAQTGAVTLDSDTVSRACATATTSSSTLTFSSPTTSISTITSSFLTSSTSTTTLSPTTSTTTTTAVTTITDASTSTTTIIGTSTSTITIRSTTRSTTTTGGTTSVTTIKSTTKSTTTISTTSPEADLQCLNEVQDLSTGTGGGGVAKPVGYIESATGWQLVSAPSPLVAGSPVYSVHPAFLSSGKTYDPLPWATTPWVNPGAWIPGKAPPNDGGPPGRINWVSPWVISTKGPFAGGLPAAHTIPSVTAPVGTYVYTIQFNPVFGGTIIVRALAADDSVTLTGPGGLSLTAGPTPWVSGVPSGYIVPASPSATLTATVFNSGQWTGLAVEAAFCPNTPTLTTSTSTTTITSPTPVTTTIMNTLPTTTSTTTTISSPTTITTATTITTTTDTSLTGFRANLSEQTTFPAILTFLLPALSVLSAGVWLTILASRPIQRRTSVFV